MGPESKLRRGLRIALFSSAAAFIVAGPAYRHWLEGRNHIPPRWMMFRDIALNLYEVRFETRDERGERVRLDRFEELGYDSRWVAPRAIMTFRTKTEAREVARRLCDKRQGQPVFMHLRVAQHSGWKVVEDGQRDFCSHHKERSR